MQSGQGVTSAATVGASMDTNVIHLQPANNNNAQQQTRYVASNVANQSQFVNIPRAPGQYITIQPGGLQILPVQGNNATQYIQVQLQDLQQSGNVLQIQNLQPLAKASPAFVPIQQIIPNQSNPTQNNLNQKVSIQLVQHNATDTSKDNVPETEAHHNQQQLSVSSLQPVHSPSSVVRTVGQSMPVVQIGNLTRNTSTHNSVAGLPLTVTSSSTLFQALKKAAISTTLAESSTSKNTSSSINNASAVVTQAKPNDQNSFPGAIMVMSDGNKQSIIIPKTQSGNVSQINPIFLPITMANNLSVLTNQVMGSKRVVQFPQSSVLKVQQQIAPRVFQAQANNAPTTISTSSSAAVAVAVNQNPTQKYFIQPATSLVQQQQGPQLQLQQQQQPQQFIIQAVQQNIAHINAQRKKDVFVSTASSSKQNRPQTASASSSSAADSKPLKKPCNCTKSQCLKLYCECFANGEFCNNCNCRMCLNNMKHEAERSKAIKACLERNPYAFHPKIGKGRVKGDNERRHTKGCNCKRSGCLKNYCECYEAKILCSSLCRCCGCKNFEESDDRKTLMHLADAAEVRVQQQNAAKSKLATQMDILPKKVHNSLKEKLPVSFLTADVSKATCQILVAKAAEGENERKSSVELEKSIILEFSRCLDQIIDKSHKAKKGKR